MKVFISFSSMDKKIAEKIYDRLKRNDIDCWISTRDIPPGADYQACIVEAISQTDVVVLVFSSRANTSPEIAKELSLASKKILIPARIEDVLPQGSFQYQLSNRQFVDLFDDFDRRLDDLALRIKNVVLKTGDAPSGTMQGGNIGRGKKKGAVIGAAIVAGVAVAGATGWFVMKKNGGAATTAELVSNAPAMPKNSSLEKATPTLIAAETKPAMPVGTAALAALPPAAPPAAVAATAAPAPAATESPTATVSPVAKEEHAAEAPAATVSSKMRGVMTMVGKTTGRERLLAIETLVPQLPEKMNHVEAAELINGTGDYRVNAIGLIANNLVPGLEGKQVSAIMGDLGGRNRLSSIEALTKQNKIAENLRSPDAKLILENTGDYRTNAIGLLAPLLATNLAGADVETVLGNTGGRNRLSSLEYLVKARKIRQPLSPAEAAAILGPTGDYRTNAIGLLAPLLAQNLDGKAVSEVLGNLTNRNRLSALESLTTAGCVSHKLGPDDFELILQNSNDYRTNAIQLLTPFMAK
jgi:hypothetical protein